MNSTSLTINGRSIYLEAGETGSLLDVLRNQFRLTGARFGCGLEQCGACVVLIDGEPSYSCTRAATTVIDRAIETVESLRDQSPPHPLLQAFLDEQAGQCGYCLSGILMSAKALLDRNTTPSREDIVTALDRHLCRCGAHNRIIRAVERAACMMREQTT